MKTVLKPLAKSVLIPLELTTAAHRISLYVNGNNVTYFNSFGVEHIPEEIKKLIDKQKL